MKCYNIAFIVVHLHLSVVTQCIAGFKMRVSARFLAHRLLWGKGAACFAVCPLFLGAASPLPRLVVRVWLMKNTVFKARTCRHTYVYQMAAPKIINALQTVLPRRIAMRCSPTRLVTKAWCRLREMGMGCLGLVGALDAAYSGRLSFSLLHLLRV